MKPRRRRAQKTKLPPILAAPEVGYELRRIEEMLAGNEPLTERERCLARDAVSEALRQRRIHRPKMWGNKRVKSDNLKPHMEIRMLNWMGVPIERAIEELVPNASPERVCAITRQYGRLRRRALKLFGDVELDHDKLDAIAKRMIEKGLRKKRT